MRRGGGAFRRRFNTRRWRPGCSERSNVRRLKARTFAAKARAERTVAEIMLARVLASGGLPELALTSCWLSQVRAPGVEKDSGRIAIPAVEHTQQSVARVLRFLSCLRPSSV